MSEFLWFGTPYRYDMPDWNKMFITDPMNAFGQGFGQGVAKGTPDLMWAGVGGIAALVILYAVAKRL